MPPRRANSAATGGTRFGTASKARSSSSSQAAAAAAAGGGKSSTKSATNAVISAAKGKAGKGAGSARAGSAEMDTTSSDKQRSFSNLELEKVKDLPHLDVDDPVYDQLWMETRRKLGMPAMKPIHVEKDSRVQMMLRTFDFDPLFGPALGMTRLQRWQRAHNLGDEPPEEIRHMLSTKEGVLWPELREPVLAGMGV
ncbi:hypothetical protein IE81DRAFT_326097 [Ceraceosorus guamensis]|uniref:DNA polymerase delta subunit 4 n=1 Tax=Ceraceosorus guamensis TaxID=1522189 RepID=A0A316VS53_9BASI|nr:hypothetical protein IE81DRAFT_326097 [Ceraceosorus guamensis]PWN39878.1 hypothetical protein IE81DRAFT_326097 [Ceraceosorus guamensis]